jgi:hypothetical protein
MWFRSPSLLQLSYALALQMRQLATTHPATARASTRVGTGALACAAAAICAAACAARTTKPRQASTISPTHLSSAPDTTTYRRSGTTACTGHPMQTAPHADRDPCRPRPVQTATRADRDSKTYASVASTTTPAPKGRNSLAQGVSPGTRPTKSRAPEGRQPVPPPISTSSASLLTSISINIDIHQSKLSSPSPRPLPRPPQASRCHPPAPLLVPDHSRPRLLS